jgi:lipopolysaccharide biosynthesis glycosyltransferase
VPVVFATDDNYVPLLSVAIQSIMENAKRDAEYHFFILHETVSPENQETLMRQVSAHSSCKLDISDVSPYTGGIDFLNMNFTRAAYYRFVLPYSLREYPYVIYIDCDVACVVDIAELLDYDYSEFALAATRRIISGDSNWGWVESHAKGLGLENPRDYFNSGVLVFNTKRFREIIDLDELYRMASENEFLFPDQDILNLVFKDDVAFIPMRWNLLTDKAFSGLSEEEAEEYEEAKKNPAILHFNGDKPLESGDVTERLKLFWDYASRTPFLTVLQNRLKENEAKKLEDGTIDPESEECILFSNNKREAQSAEAALARQGIGYKTKRGDADFGFKIFVANDDVEKALDVLMNDL